MYVGIFKYSSTGVFFRVTEVHARSSTLGVHGCHCHLEYDTRMMTDIIAVCKFMAERIDGIETG